MRRLKDMGGIYRRSADDRWFAVVDLGGDGARRRRTVSSAMFCTTLKRMQAELGPKRRDEVVRRQRAIHLEEARKLGTHTSSEWYAYCRQVGPYCEYCGTRCSATKDHRTPISRGGSDALDNLAVACFRCNTMKNSYTEEEFRQRIAELGGLRPGYNKRLSAATWRTIEEARMKRQSPPTRAAGRGA